MTNNFTTENLFQWIVDEHVSLVFDLFNKLKISRINQMSVGLYQRIVIIHIVHHKIKQRYLMH
jgi:hypothetical protein